MAATMNATNPLAYRRSSFELRVISVALIVLNFVRFHGILMGHDIAPWQVLFLLSGCGLMVVGRVYVPRLLCGLALTIGLHTVAVLLVRDTISPLTIQQVAIVSIGSMICWSYVKYLGADGVVQVYYYCALVFAMSLLIEEAIYIGAPSLRPMLYAILRNNGATVGPLLRASGFLAEPSQAGVLLTPAIYLAAARQKRSDLTILGFASALTFSSLALMSLVVTALITLRLGMWRLKMRWLVIATCMLAGVALLPPIQSRFGALYMGVAIVASGALPTMRDYLTFGGTVATLVLNALVAVHAVWATHFVGVGFGAFSDAFSLYAGGLIDLTTAGGRLFYSQRGGGSLFVRILAELGVVGAALIVWAISRVNLCVRRVREHSRWDASYLRLPSVQGFVLGVIVCSVYALRKEAYFDWNFLVCFWLAVYCGKQILRARYRAGGEGVDGAPLIVEGVGRLVTS
jgi:hypothetical protein